MAAGGGGTCVPLDKVNADSGNEICRTCLIFTIYQHHPKLLALCSISSAKSFAKLSIVNC